MTNDYRQGLYKEICPWSTPRDYHYYRVRVTVTNKESLESIYGDLYLSAKRSLQWLQTQLSSSMYYPLPVDYFFFKYDIYEVEDSDDILFQHITTKQTTELQVSKFVMFLVCSKSWHKNILKKLFHKIQLFLHKRIFISKPKITIQTI